MCVNCAVHYPGTRLLGGEPLEVGPRGLVQHVPVALQRPAGDRGRRRGQDHALHRPRFDARPEHVERSADSRLDQFFLPTPPIFIPCPSPKQN
jgi:hypothetical protein